LRRVLIGLSPKDAEPIDLTTYAPDYALRMAEEDDQRAIPALAKDQIRMLEIEQASKQVPTSHQLFLGDGRKMDMIPDGSVHLAVTSPPYWTLKEYPDNAGQLGQIEDYEDFLEELDKVWRHVYRVLVPGGRLIVVVGDVCLSRRVYGRHMVVPLHASIQEHCRDIEFDNLAPIIWYKIANASFEVENGSGGFLGKPYEPNAVIKNDIEYILFQRKPGGSPGVIANLRSRPGSSRRFPRLRTANGSSRSGPWAGLRPDCTRHRTRWRWRKD